MNIYLDLTRKFNSSGIRAILAGGQAVVLHRLAIMSKDGDWILREDPQTMQYVLSVLGRYGARYRFGAPLDVRWMAGGWSAHLEFQWQELRVRTDFVTRLAKYLEAAKPWAAAWPELSRQMEGLVLPEAHRLMVQRAEGLLPFTVPGGWP
ncbi:MAG: hypothetical protein A2Y76_08725 [Planctomycetes bacterium RBG_13_60_9]|nr:MAG: hypothetical protein A2Y76_08725 [Planctomycetes bacterium RBG_13_60_9]